MKRHFTLLIAASLLSGHLLAADAGKPAGQSPFSAVQIVSAGEITYPVGAAAWGTLVFRVWISANGSVEDVEVCRALTPFTDEAVHAIKSWKFRPALLRGKPVASYVTVAATFNPRVPFPESVPLPPLVHEEKTDRPQSAFLPADVLQAAFPPYPAGAVNPGTTVLEVSLSGQGEVERTKVVREFAPYTAKALDAVARWKFTPAKLSDHPVSSRIILAFVFPTLPPPLPPHDR